MNGFHSRMVLAGLAGCFFLAPALLEVGGIGSPKLEGSWEVTSVQRDGEADPMQIGARLTFTGNEVKFQPTVLDFVDGTS